MAKAKKSTSIAADYSYGTTRIRDRGGRIRHSRGNGDAVANALLIFRANGGSLESIVAANKLNDRMAPHLGKEEGLRRMILGIMLRALVRHGTPVKIGRVVVETLDQKIELPTVVLKTAGTR